MARSARSAVLVLIASIILTGCATFGSRDDERRRSFVVPVVEVVGMDALINLGGRTLLDPADFAVSAASIRRNARGPWVVDNDPFEVNQFLHPYQGAMYHGIARSSGLNYWQATAYTFAGSALWEIAGETTRPSKNDQIASGIAGSFLGEPLFRTARLILLHAGKKPGIVRTLVATIVSPPAGVNRMVFGDRFDSDAPGSIEALDLRLELGMSAVISRSHRSFSTLPFTTPFVGFSVDYGFPGEASATHARPFDQFKLEGVASSGSFESLTTRGLLVGKDYGGGPLGHGVWGLYGGYDYFAPDVFRLSSTSASVGTSAELRPGGGLTLQVSALLGAGFTAASSGVAPVDPTDDRDYHYGVSPQALVNLRTIAGRRAALDLSAREYRISDIASFGTRQRDRIVRADASFAVRLAGPHGLAVRYLFSRRDATPPDLPRLTQGRSHVGLYYVFLGSRGFGTSR